MSVFNAYYERFTFIGLLIYEKGESSESLCNHSKVLTLVIERAEPTLSQNFESHTFQNSHLITVKNT